MPGRIRFTTRTLRYNQMLWVTVDGLEQHWERARVDAIAITVLPPIDTPPHVRKFLRQRHALGALDWLIGPLPELRKAWKRFAVLSALETGKANAHSADVRIFDSGGIWVSTLHVGVDLTPANLAHDIRVALRARR